MRAYCVIVLTSGMLSNADLRIYGIFVDKAIRFFQFYQNTQCAAFVYFRLVTNALSWDISMVIANSCEISNPSLSQLETDTLHPSFLPFSIPNFSVSLLLLSRGNWAWYFIGHTSQVGCKFRVLALAGDEPPSSHFIHWTLSSY